jgi:hypothetical protein
MRVHIGFLLSVLGFFRRKGGKGACEEQAEGQQGGNDAFHDDFSYVVIR